MENVISLAMIAEACKKKRLLITTTQRHCREKGHAEGGYEYRPLVRGFNI
jgi:hypothetical protein